VGNEAREGTRFFTDNGRCNFARTATYSLLESVLTARSSPLTQLTIATSDLPLALFKPLGCKASFTYAKKNFM
jgi:hypothetical protein